MTATGAGAEPAVSALAPLRTAAYRSLWLALLAANIGTWMQTVGAQWLLIHQSNAATLVALVQTASLLPVLLLALPAGALADTFDRRHLLISVQLFMVAVATALTLLTAAGRMPPALLLTLTFAFGVGQALTLPAWAAVIPELVPRDLLRSASALGSISVNVARAVGPAVAGVLIARVGVAPVFALNAVAFAVFAFALVRWRPGNARAVEVPERFTAALRAGGRYVRHSPTVRRLLRRALVFVVPASALWALLPVVASRRLGMDSSGYGLLLAALGVGAIAGGLLLPWTRTRITANQFLLLAGVVYGTTLIVVGTVRVVPVVLVALLPAGVAWVTVLANVNAEIQLFLPGWVRARGLAVYQVVQGGAQAVGAFAWGLLADMSGLVVAFLAAGVLMVIGGLTSQIWPLPELRGAGRHTETYQPRLNLALEPDPRVGPVLVTVTYRVPAKRRAAFLSAMEVVRGARQRTGAMRWGIFQVGEAPDRYVEVYLVPSWDEHLRQHGGRLTGADQEAEQRAHDLADGEPEVRHLIPPDGGEQAIPPTPAGPGLPG
ncbi:MFS transporter [Micromonospora mirobrigensis]|uniref:Predicted arabinose efflux permease, MFS family n=1 Tax=Micromonospora mirobrigensis TaxID=262898 RepID=A0A1C4VII7_9ACTN|nr:MFS transporter [Micromonospora mirobrigensis]SCE83778.1 Predicted arabinose efflux permease, MFS family [Micromonospora mirobrigensis]